MEELPDQKGFKSFSEELQFHLVRAEWHARHAHDMLYVRGGRRRSYWFASALGRAQSILMGLAKQELARKEENDSNRRMGGG